MGIESLVQTASAAVGAAVVTGAAARKYWTGREIRQQAEFRRAVTQLITEQTAELIQTNTDLLRQQAEHLSRQDRAIASLRRTVEQIRNSRHD